MLGRTVDLQNHDGSHNSWICQPEADRMAARGEIFRVSKRKAAKKVYRYHPPVRASQSRETPAQITNADLHALVGLHRVDEIWYERLIGLELIPEGTPMPYGGYLA